MTKGTLVSTDRDRVCGAIPVHLGPKDCLLKVLDLLSDLLQFGLAADDSLGDRSIIRFCSERVEFAKNLLRNELQRSPDRFLAAQVMRKLSKMTFESRQFLRYISAIGK